jgi:hypothetical protein
MSQEAARAHGGTSAAPVAGIAAPASRARGALDLYA